MITRRAVWWLPSKWMHKEMRAKRMSCHRFKINKKGGGSPGSWRAFVVSGHHCLKLRCGPAASRNEWAPCWWRNNTADEKESRHEETEETTHELRRGNPVHIHLNRFLIICVGLGTCLTWTNQECEYFTWCHIASVQGCNKLIMKYMTLSESVE